MPSVRAALLPDAILLALLAAVALSSSPLPGEDTIPAEAEVEEAIQRAVEILIAGQESYEEGKPKAEWPYEGVYRESGKIPIGYRVGGTSIVARALLEVPGWKDDTARQEAVARAFQFVIEGLDHDGMAAGFNGAYDVRGWGHTYALFFLLRALELDVLSKEHTKIARARVSQLVKVLEETEIHESGGWNYSRRGGPNRPSEASTFMTAPTVQALLQAAKQGAQVREDVIGRAVKTLEGARLESGAFQYGTNPRKTGTGFEAVPGAIGRMAVCETTLHLLGRGSVERVRGSLDAFFEHWEWLEKRRKQTGTHEAPYMIAPYYFFYAHYYAAQAIEILPSQEREAYRQKLLRVLWKVREESGGWNDRTFARSEHFGTAMTLLTLLQPTIPLPPGVGKARVKKRAEKSDSVGQ